MIFSWEEICKVRSTPIRTPRMCILLRRLTLAVTLVANEMLRGHTGQFRSVWFAYRETRETSNVFLLKLQ